MLAHLPISPRGLDFLVLTKRIAASGNEIVVVFWTCFAEWFSEVRLILAREIYTNLSVSPKNLIESLNPLANGLL